jgi:arabinose-5-phosphate isomerase
MESPYTWFRSVIEAEAEALAGCVSRLEARAVEQAVDLLVHCRGKVVLLGVGKSGLIARKVAATLSSTGTTAAFLHASDALHGDLGLLSASDVVIMISHSGETDELTSLVPHVQRRSVPVIAITGNMDSTLARCATVCLDGGVEREACPLGLAPTSSTTVALAIGDALAMAVARTKGLTAEDFAINHPAGRLGKRLTLRVSDLMQSGANNPVIAPDADWRTLIHAISSYRVGAVSVVDADGSLLGIVTDGDLRRVMARVDLGELSRSSAADIMTQQPRRVAASDLAYHALKRMKEGELGVSVLPVVDSTDHVVGMLRLQDLVRAGI